ncbi:hypothetical protein BFW38_07845 [Terasakiispira papahanaumokuakeensis]|uniref:YjiS-like domain-containing protein n=1 Tax=Terasakiispira papahanaumokuakeensis TaxID=197479 RepID=A0A1E2V903_9GAMM|nr:DUF1127 domain-containing protein [Terasakiispira papahanaumokuakeensis]ODC03471.1 hypothetical protein BFW38_07845 [Terasakiispira papahanaumokuakeensis]
MILTAQGITAFFERCRRRLTLKKAADTRSGKTTQKRPLTALERHHSRQMLRHLDARLLRDIGLTEADAQREVSKPIWK